MTIASLIAIGLTAGVLSGVFGIGGGVIIVPALVVLLGFTAQQAAGTSLGALLLPVGLLGVLEYWRAGEVNLVHALVLAFRLLFGAFVGARLGLSLPTDVLQRAFGVLLLFFGLRLVFFA